jgi:cell division protein FtsA
MARPIVVGLEIGTTKVAAAVGEMRDDGSIIITGVGKHDSTGVRKGEIVDAQNAILCVRAALTKAEEQADVDIYEVHLAVSGGRIEGDVNRGEVLVADPSRRVSADDVKAVQEVARAFTLTPDREVLHSLSQHFSIDGQDDVLHPEGMVAQRLALNMLLIHGVRVCIDNVVNVVQSVPMAVADVAFSGVCSALAVMTPEQRRSGVIVIDLGGGKTDYAVYADDVIVAAGAIGVGGDHVTNDIALAFRVSTTQAERLKREAGSAVVEAGLPASRRATVPAEGGFQGREISLKALHTVIQARVDEVFVMIRKKLAKASVLHHIGAGVILTGGGSRLANVTKNAEKVFDLPCGIGRPINVTGQAEAMENPEFSTCCGMVRYGFSEPDDVVGSWLDRLLVKGKRFFGG